jgi:hypothetical protein
MFQIKVVEKIKTHFPFSNLFLVYEIMSKKYGGVREAADDNMHGG